MTISFSKGGFCLLVFCLFVVDGCAQKLKLNEYSVDAEVNINYSDYRKTPEGYVFAYTVSMGNSGNNMNYEKIEVNKAVDEKLYKPVK